MYTYADAVTWFPDPVFVVEFRIRHYAAELKDSGIIMLEVTEARCEVVRDGCSP